MLLFVMPAKAGGSGQSNPLLAGAGMIVGGLGVVEQEATRRPITAMSRTGRFLMGGRRLRLTAVSMIGLPLIPTIVKLASICGRGSS